MSIWGIVYAFDMQRATMADLIEESRLSDTCALGAILNTSFPNCPSEANVSAVWASKPMKDHTFRASKLLNDHIVCASTMEGPIYEGLWARRPYCCVLRCPEKNHAGRPRTRFLPCASDALYDQSQYIRGTGKHLKPST